MPYFNFYQMVSFAKVFNAAMGAGYPQAITIDDIDVTIEALKKMADNSPYWTQEQKDMYKLLADYTKDRMKGNQHV